MSEKEKKVSEMSEAEVKEHFDGKPLEEVEAAIEKDAIPATSDDKAPKAGDSTPEGKKVDDSQKQDEAGKTEAGTKEPTPEEIKAENVRLKAETAAAEKRVADTQREYHRKTQEAAELNRRLAEVTKPQILKDSPELEEAIKHVAGNGKNPTVADEQRKAVFVNVVKSVHEDAEKLSLDPEFRKVMEEKLAFLNGMDVLDHPIEVIKVISDWKLDRMRTQSEADRTKAVDEARIEERGRLERTRRELDAQGGVPAGGKGTRPVAASDDDELAKAKKAFADGGLRGVTSYMDKLASDG